MTYFPLGPAPAPDGLGNAFRAARRRRLRTAASAAAMPLVVVVAALAAAPAGGGASSLETTPTDRTAPTAAGTPAVPAGAPGAARPGPPAAGPVAYPGVPGAVGAGPAAPGELPPTPLPSALATAPPAPPEGDVLVLRARRTASARVTLAKPLTPAYDAIDHSGNGGYTGVWFASDDGRVAGGWFSARKPDDGASWLGSRVGNAATLRPGTYTVYVVSPGPTTLRIPLGKGEKGFTVEARTPRTSSFRSARTDVDATDSTVDVRLPISGGRRTVGVAGGWLFGASQAGPSATTCLPRRGEACAEGDVRGDGGDAAQVNGSIGSAVPIGAGYLATPRDVLLQAKALATTTGRATAFYVVLDL